MLINESGCAERGKNMSEMIRKKLPIGIESFEEIRTEGFYYIDKTGMIRDLLCNWGKVNLFTRPRRFGKSLNMSMLRCFFEIAEDTLPSERNRTSLFEGLEITEERGLCEKYMGRFPVISISLKGVNGKDYEAARAMMCSVVGNEAMRFQFLQRSDRLTDKEKELYDRLIMVGSKEEAVFHMPDSVLMGSLYTLSALLRKHYSQKVIVLIDEYDVPLAKANENGYYDEMVLLIRNMLEQTLKTNENLYFAVLTGCLRVAKESIFTGLNNLNALTITDVAFEEYFGFSDGEVRNLLEYYDLSDYYDLVKEWYDGYCFGNLEVYCPWDVICYCSRLRLNPGARPEAYWSNTSSNEVIRRLLEQAGPATRRDIERLIAGETVTKNIRQELTYKDIYKSDDNIWSVLFTTGYLTRRGETDDGRIQLAIPNREIKNIFEEQITEWFQNDARKEGETLNAFCDAFINGNADGIEKRLNDYLRKTISIRDNAVRDNLKENYYHGILLGLLSYKDSWYLASNKETGEGYGDILAEVSEKEIGILIEIKYAQNGSLDDGCRKALRQIKEKNYAEQLYEDGMQTILKYGIAFYKKRCRVMLEKESLKA